MSDTDATPIITVSPDAGNEGFYRIMDLCKGQIMWGWKMRDGTVIYGEYVDNGSVGPFEYVVIDAHPHGWDHPNKPTRITLPITWVQAVEYL